MAKINKKSRYVLLRPPYIIVVVILIAAGVYFISRFTFLSGYSNGSAHTSIPYTKGEVNNNQTSPTNTNKSTQTYNSAQNSNTVNTSSTLLIPTGDFVSNHNPNLSGSPSPNTMTSVCDTTPGATCSISFYENAVVKSLPSHIVDSSGSTYWINWKLQDIGLTAGSWKIQAIATMNGQSKTADDATRLTVSE
jgi:hypothetical protein